MLGALGPSWTGLHLLKLSLKCFAMIQGGGGRQRAEWSCQCHYKLPVANLVPTLHTKHETIENVEVDLHSHYSRVKVLDGEQFI